jgi:hypothetical protein
VGVSKNGMKEISSLDGNEVLVKAKEAQVMLSPQYHKLDSVHNTSIVCKNP